MSSFNSFLSTVSSKAQAVAASVAEKAEKVDTSKIRETAARCKAQASDALAKASELAGPQLQSASRKITDTVGTLKHLNPKLAMNPHACFGVPLEVLAHRNDTGETQEQPRVPLALEKMLAHLQERGAARESQLFLLSAPPPAVKALRDAFDVDATQVSLESAASVHVVAALLRQWVIELPEPLLTFNLYEAFLDAAGGADAAAATLPASGGSGAALGPLRSAAQALPPAHRLAARRLLGFLAACLPAGGGTAAAARAGELALAFGPALLRPRPEGRFGGALAAATSAGGGAGSALVGLLEDLPAVVAAVRLLLLDADAVFAEPAAAVVVAADPVPSAPSLP